MSVAAKRLPLVYADRASDIRALAKQLLRDSGHVVFAEAGIADELIYYLIEEGSYLLSQKQADQLTRRLAEGKSFASVRTALVELNAVACGDRTGLLFEAEQGHPLLAACGAVPVTGLVRVRGYGDMRRKAAWLAEQKEFIPVMASGHFGTERSKKMDINSEKIEQIVKEVLQGMTGAPAAGAARPAAAGSIPKTSRVAMLTALEHYDIKEYPIPELGDDDILVKVEGCGVCGTDAHEFKRDPFGLIPLVLGHEGTGEIVKMGKNVKKDSAGKPLAVGDKVVTCMIFKDNPDITMFDLNKQNVGGADVYGLLPDDDVHLNGWFADYLVVRGGSTIFNVSDLSLDLRILIEPCAVLVHAVERAKTTGILRFNSRVVVQGCGPIGLICIAVLRTMGIENIVAVDGEDKRLAFAMEMGANATVNFKNFKGQEALAKGVEDAFGGYLADFAFQCTGSPVAHSNIYKFIRNGGGLCELGFFINGGDATINPHFDICAKEITTVGSWVYTLRDYATTFDFLKRAKGIGLPIEKLITHKFPLDKINEAHETNLKMEGLKIAIINQ